MNCPLCIDEVLDVTHRGGIEVDVCPRCRGIWLDRGELDRLLERERRSLLASEDHVDEDFFAEIEGRRRPSTPTLPGRDRPRRRDDDDDDDDDRHRKKSKKRKAKGLLEDLLDFDF